MSNPVLSHADPMPLAATRSHRATCNTLIRGALELNLMPFENGSVIAEGLCRDTAMDIHPVLKRGQ